MSSPARSWSLTSTAMASWNFSRKRTSSMQVSSGRPHMLASYQRGRGNDPVVMERLGGAEAGFRSLTEAIDTTTPAGRMMMQMVGAFAEFERAMLRERTKAGLDAARREGRIGGRRPKLSPRQQAEIRKMVTRGDKTAADAARLFKIHPATVCRLLARPPDPPIRKTERTQ
jgi:hypothetical protein